MWRAMSPTAAALFERTTTPVRVSGSYATELENPRVPPSWTRMPLSDGEVDTIHQPRACGIPGPCRRVASIVGKAADDTDGSPNEARNASMSLTSDTSDPAPASAGTFQRGAGSNAAS